MMCIKHVLIYFLVLPIPAASPIFILLFIGAAFIAIKPCGYCLSLLAILFLSTSPHSPFLHPSLNSPSEITSNSTSSSIPSQLPLNAPLPERKWISLNGGRYSSPNLVGYKEMDKAISFSSSSSSSDNPDVDQYLDQLRKRMFGWDLGQSIFSTLDPKKEITGNLVLDKIIQPYLRPIPSSSVDSISSPSVGEVPRVDWRNRKLPKNYIDFSWKGIGFIIDFGLKRSEEGIKWEIEEVLGEEWTRPTVENEKRQLEEKERFKVEKVESDLEASRSKIENNHNEKINGKSENFWSKIPLVGGSW